MDASFVSKMVTNTMPFCFVPGVAAYIQSGEVAVLFLAFSTLFGLMDKSMHQLLLSNSSYRKWAAILVLVSGGLCMFLSVGTVIWIILIPSIALTYSALLGVEGRG
ncbi:hypothetical protein [Vibrio sp. TRT 2004]|uniref:hypothetical protein n=1 Tax=Vibrio sp. TRT 2004 TaxID=3418506 RepID=UPI003CEE2224